jgi:hypothetical protein
MTGETWECAYNFLGDCGDEDSANYGLKCPCALCKECPDHNEKL